MNIKMITHTDLDGVSCYIVAKKAFSNDNIDCIFVNYNETLETLKLLKDEYKNYDYIIITDLSFSEESEEIKILDEISKDVSLIYVDHHITTPEENQERYYLHLDTTNSATYGLYDYLNSKMSNPILISSSMQQYCKYVSEWDTWQWKESENAEICQSLNRIFTYLGATDFCKAILSFDFKNNEEFVLANYLKLINKKEKEKETLDCIKKLNNMKISTLDGLKVGIILIERNTSIVCDYILNEKNLDIDFILVYNINYNSISLRSSLNSPVDVSFIAKTYGGGGHFHAAGFNLQKLKILSSNKYDKIKNLIINSIF